MGWIGVDIGNAVSSTTGVGVGVSTGAGVGVGVSTGAGVGVGVSTDAGVAVGVGVGDGDGDGELAAYSIFLGWSVSIVADTTAMAAIPTPQIMMYLEGKDILP